MRQSRKVQAQRKFAQGVCIPPAASAPTAAPERRENHASGSQSTNNIGMSARSLLDVISLRNLHNHDQPVVLIHRLRGNTLSNQIMSETKASQPQRKARQPKKTKAKVTKRMHSMTLRTRKRRNWNYLIRKKVAKPKKRNHSPDFSVEDNKPLKYFTESSTPQREGHANTIENLPLPNATGYYGERQIHQWMNDSTSVVNRTSSMAINEMVVFPSFPLPDVVECPAIHWITSQDYINGTKQLLASRCSQCESCQRIDRYIKVANILKCQVLKKPGSNLKQNPSKRRRSTRRSKARSPSPAESEYVYLDLLKHDTDAMMELKIDKKHEQQVISARLVPIANTSGVFNLKDYDAFMVQLLENSASTTGSTVQRVMRDDGLYGQFLPNEGHGLPIISGVMDNVNFSSMSSVSHVSLAACDSSRALPPTSGHSAIGSSRALSHTPGHSAPGPSRVFSPIPGYSRALSPIPDPPFSWSPMPGPSRALLPMPGSSRSVPPMMGPSRSLSPILGPSRAPSPRPGPSRTLSPVPGPSRAFSPIPASSQALTSTSNQSNASSPTPDQTSAWLISMAPTFTEPCVNPPSANQIQDQSNNAASPVLTQTTDDNNEDELEENRSVSDDSLKKVAKEGLEENSGGPAVLVAPVSRPSKEEFADPISYSESVALEMKTFGVCKIAVPFGFKPKCHLKEDMRFNVFNQYISRLFNRWGPASRELCAIKLCLQQQNVNFNRPPLLDGVEVNLPKLYHLVQQNGGLQNVINKKRWARIASEMNAKGPHVEKKLDQIYVKYLLPYDTLSHQERQDIMRKVEKSWSRKYQRLLDRASNPLHRKKKLLLESDSSGDESEDDTTGNALAEAEDCVVPGISMNLQKFKKVSGSAVENYFHTIPCTENVENEFWRLVLHGTEHMCVNSASIDTGEEGYGFTKDTNDPYGSHPWNLKMLRFNYGNVLRALGSVIGVTVPTLHLGMMFSTSCWHRDPHGMPWIEYMHSGAAKIWYGIPDSQSDNFRKAVETMCPTLSQNKSLWLASDIAMIPPSLLHEHNVKLSRLVQYPGEYVLVCPKAYSCSINTGYNVTESVYFANKTWLESVSEVFQEAKDSCEPTMYSLEQLLIAIVQDEQTPVATLSVIYPQLSKIIEIELTKRDVLKALDINIIDKSETNQRRHQPETFNGDLEECEICRCTLYLSKVRGAIEESSVCLQHALELHQKKNFDSNEFSIDIIIFFSDSYLLEVLESMKKRLHMHVYNS